MVNPLILTLTLFAEGRIRVIVVPLVEGVALLALPVVLAELVLLLYLLLVPLVERGLQLRNLHLLHFDVLHQLQVAFTLLAFYLILADCSLLKVVWSFASVANPNRYLLLLLYFFGLLCLRFIP